MRRDGDSNPGYPLGVYTLSRRASSTTRASLQGSPSVKKAVYSDVFRAVYPLFQLQMYSFFWSYESFREFNLAENPEINKL